MNVLMQMPICSKMKDNVWVSEWVRACMRVYVRVYVYEWVGESVVI